MNARIRRFSSENPVVPFTGEVNRCAFCGSLPRYARSKKCSGYHLGCECESIRTDSCTDSLIRENANKLREEWNEMVVDAVLNPRFMRKYGAENGSICVIRSTDCALLSVYEDMDQALAFLKIECKRNASVDYDVCQFVQRDDGNYILAHVATSKILSYVGNWEGFDFNLMIKIDN